MIVVRDIFQLKFGKAKEAVQLWKEGLEAIKKSGINPDRILVDLVGPSYTLVLESSYPSLTDYEQAHAKATGHYDEWRRWYDKFVPFAESGRREIFTVVE